MSMSIPMLLYANYIGISVSDYGDLGPFIDFTGGHASRGKISDLKLRRVHFHDDAAVTVGLSTSIGSPAVVMVQPLDNERLPLAAPLIYEGMLDSYVPPQWDANSADLAVDSLVITVKSVRVGSSVDRTTGFRNWLLERHHEPEPMHDIGRLDELPLSGAAGAAWAH